MKGSAEMGSKEWLPIEGEVRQVGKVFQAVGTAGAME